MTLFNIISTHKITVNIYNTSSLSTLLAVVRAGIALDDNRTTLVQMNRSQRWMFKCLVYRWRLVDAILLWFPENYEYWIRIWRNCLTIPTTTSKLRCIKLPSCIVPSFFLILIGKSPFSSVSFNSFVAEIKSRSQNGECSKCWPDSFYSVLAYKCVCKRFRQPSDWLMF
jgi:hypothetical protein